MNEEQNAAGTDSQANETDGKESVTTGSEPQSQNISNSDNATLQDDYYAVDHSKREVLSTIGDGEMHDEGLVGEGEAATDIQSSTERLTNEQDEAESHDSEQ